MSSALAPPPLHRGRSSSITNSLSLKSLAPRTRPTTLDLPPEPQTPSSLVRKDTAPTTMVTHLPSNPGASSSSSFVAEEHLGSPHRPMLSVLLSLSVGMLPSFLRPSSPSPARAPKPLLSTRRLRVWNAGATESVTDSAPPSPFTSLFLAPPQPANLLPTPADPATIRRHRSSFAPIVLLLVCFVFSLFPVAAALSSLPISAFRSIPKTLKDIAQLGHELQSYADSSSQGLFHVLAVLSLTAVWKHAWSVPGSVVLNVIAGVIISPLPATLLMGLLTTIGSLLATLLSTPLAPLVSALFPRALAVTRTALQGSSSASNDDLLSEKSATVSADDQTPTWVRLVVMRLIGVVPWSGINVACGVCGVSLWECAIGSFIGTLPWTAVTCQIGDIIQTLSAASSGADGAPPQTLSSVLASPSIILKLIFLSALSLGPVLGRDKLRTVLGGSGSSTPAGNVAAEAEELLSPIEEKEEEAKWKFWTRSRSNSRRTSLDEASLSEEGEITSEK